MAPDQSSVAEEGRPGPQLKHRQPQKPSHRRRRSIGLAGPVEVVSTVGLLEPNFLPSEDVDLDQDRIGRSAEENLDAELDGGATTAAVTTVVGAGAFLLDVVVVVGVESVVRDGNSCWNLRSMNVDAG